MSLQRKLVRRWLPLVLGLGWVAACTSAGRPVAPPNVPPPPDLARVNEPAESKPESTPEVVPVEPMAPSPAPSSTWAGRPSDKAPPGADGLGVPLLVGLATDLDSFELPCCGQSLELVLAGERIAAVESIVVEPAPGSARAAEWRLQAAALKDEVQAVEMAEDLERRTALPSDARFDARTGLYRVRVGRFSERSAADTAKSRWTGLGLGTAWVVQDGGGVEDPALRVRQGDRQTRVPGRWLAVETSSDQGLRILEGRYRGRILIYLNDRGSLNVINELDLEDYLRGVVPREMGPAAFPRIEALKAQAVAARTYTLRNLGEFEAEGFDICATPRCQVYGGLDGEHSLSDQAVEETRGQVLLYDDVIIDALYSSTCGGHTEDVEVVFPLKRAPYLRGVPCVEAGIEVIDGHLDPGTALASGVVARLLPTTGGDDRGVLEARLRRLAELAGLPAPTDRLASTERREIQRFVVSLFDLALDASLFVTPGDAEYLLGVRPSGWTDADLRRAAYLSKSGFLRSSPDLALTGPELDGLLFGLAETLLVVERQSARFQALEGRRLTLRGDLGESFVDLDTSVGLYRQREEEVVAGHLGLVAGDPVVLLRHEGRLLGVIQEVDPDGVAFDRTSKWYRWTRFRSDSKLAELVRQHYPGFPFKSFELGSRGVSGRVGVMTLRGEGGKEEKVEGLAVRWTFDLPDTRFTAKRLKPSGKEAGWLFSGGGWGHGVGMCQVGAFGMAGRGHDYREILTHYYSGVRIGMVRPRVR